MRDAVTDRAIQLYLVAVVGLGAASIGLLYALFASGFTTFVGAFTRNPGRAIQNDPSGLVLLAGVFVFIFLLVALVVLFGANYALESEEFEQ